MKTKPTVINKIIHENACETRRMNILDQKMSIRSWEMRALFTSLLIAKQPVVLTGPVIYYFWKNIVTGKPSSLQFRF